MTNPPSPPAAPSQVAPSQVAPSEALSVSELTAQMKGLVEQSFPDVWVAGEVSNLSRPSSGHCYLTLKDDGAQLRAVVWRGTTSRLKFQLADGMQLICHGRMDLYAPRGSYQLVIDQAQPLGVGELELAFRQLKEKLAGEGLFDQDRKQPLPAMPTRLAVVTSPTGAAVRDFLEVLRRRWPAAEVTILPARVQGEGAAAQIAAAIQLANRVKPKFEVLIVTRGGGGLEDLWAFNEAAVVRAIAASRVPTVSAVGHEIDVTLADLAADVRAATPTEAAERVAPSADELGLRVQAIGDRARLALVRAIQRRSERLQSLAMRRPLARPFALLEDHARRLDELDATAARSIRETCRHHGQRLATLAGKLDSLSPLAVLGRGYSLVQTTDGQLVRTTKQLKPGETITVRFAKGQVDATVSSIKK